MSVNRSKMSVSPENNLGRTMNATVVANRLQENIRSKGKKTGSPQLQIIPKHSRNKLKWNQTKTIEMQNKLPGQ